MRAVKIMVTAALATLLAASVSACTGTTGSGSGSGGASGAASPSTAVSVSAADKQVCTDIEKQLEDSTRKVGQEIAAAVQSSNVGDAERKAVNAVKALLSEEATALRGFAGKAQSADLKSALTSYATALEQLAPQINSLVDLAKLGNLNTPEIQAATDRIEQICG